MDSPDLVGNHPLALRAHENGLVLAHARVRLQEDPLLALRKGRPNPAGDGKIPRVWRIHVEERGRRVQERVTQVCAGER